VCAVVHLSARGRETRNHSAGTFASTVTDVYISVNLERSVSKGNFFLNLDSGNGRKQNNMRKEKKNKVVRLHTLLSDTYDSKVELLKI
jgi:hypothetical protein